MNGLYWVSHHKTVQNWISVTPLWLLYRLLWNMIDEISLSGNMCLIFITLHKHILLMQPRSVCTLEMGYLLIIKLWLKGNQIEYSLTSVTTLLPKIYCACYTKGRLLECLQREVALFLFTVCALTNSSTDLNNSVMWRCLLPEKHVILKVLVKMLDCILLLYQGDM
jgi:hypothetical protein